MENNVTKIENHYHISSDEFVSKIIQEERDRTIKILKEGNILVEIDGELFGVAYDNFAEREQEDHAPQISLKKVG